MHMSMHHHHLGPFEENRQTDQRVLLYRVEEQVKRSRIIVEAMQEINRHVTSARRR